MQRTLPQFVDCPEKKKPYAGDHCFDGEFEYALYKAFTTVLIFDRKRFKEDVFDLENMVLFSRIQATYADTGRREKRYYLVELDYRIKQWQLDRFFLTDHLLYQNILIPRSRQLTGGLRSFYLYLGRIVSQIKLKLANGEEPSFILTVDQASDIMEISIERNDHRKRRVKEYLDKLKEFLGNEHFEYTFFKGDNQKYAYSIKIILPIKTLEHYDDKLKTVFFSKLSKTSDMQYYKLILGGNPMKFHLWASNLSTEEQSVMTKWLFDKKSQHYIEAKEHFIRTFHEVFNIQYDNRFGEID